MFTALDRNAPNKPRLFNSRLCPRLCSSLFFFFFYILAHYSLYIFSLPIYLLLLGRLTMKLSFGIAALSLFVAASAFPNRGAGDEPKFPVPDSVTIKEGSTKCGDQAQLSCCNKVRYGKDTTVVQKGLAAGLLSNLLGAGSAAEGLGAFDQCDKLDLSVLAVQDALNQKCKQNIACCANSPGSADGDLIGATLPCIALGSIL
ncbi:hypothetical protein BJY01DRAFT_262774 [Aspergillus pseudoustus]|uniref:Hydrophobin n=1 Tax=Aspergillus pseudoustus TaxID=1810923 RepID=A0ABR4IB69_9EURO